MSTTVCRPPKAKSPSTISQSNVNWTWRHVRSPWLPSVSYLHYGVQWTCKWCLEFACLMIVPFILYIHLSSESLKPARYDAELWIYIARWASCKNTKCPEIDVLYAAIQERKTHNLLVSFAQWYWEKTTMDVCFTYTKMQLGPTCVCSQHFCGSDATSARA